jgi:dolichyl-phosphate-mannose-protein mannosyltransferase
VTATDATAPPAGEPVSALRRTQGLSVTADGRRVPAVRRRLRTGPPGDVVTGWLVTAGVTLLAGILRFWHLGTPRLFAFDETYYAKDAWSLWQRGYAVNWSPKADAAILDGRYSATLQTHDPEMVVHPEVGKWLIGAGEQLFGLNPFGWRFASAVVGTLMVLVLVRLVRRLTGSTLLGGVAGLLLCCDGLELTLSRMALLDIYVAFFLLCAVSCLVADRDWGRARLASRSSASAWASTWGPRLWWRPWRLAAGIMFGLAIGSKWTAIVPLAAFAVLTVVWDSGARRALGVRWAFLRAALIDGVPAFCYLVVVAVVVYVGTWTGWLLHAHVYETALARNNYGPYWGSYTHREAHGFFPALVQGLRSLWHYHQDVFAFHSHGLVGTTHAYQSNPEGWLVMQRPVTVASETGIQPGVEGCAAPRGSTCVRDMVLLGTPALWWGGVLASLYATWAWVGRRDWLYGVAVVGLLAAWVPFFRYADRPIFSFYAVAVLPFTVIAICLALGRLIGPATASVRRRFLGAVAAGSFVVAVVLNFAWFWPVWTYQLLTSAQWLHRVWFRSWI